MQKHTLEKFLSDFTTLCPTDTQVGAAVKNSDWWAPLKAQFDDLIWMYWPERTVFYNERFDPENEAQTAANIVRTFAIFLKSKERMLTGLWEGYKATFNPLWNVDGVTGTIWEDDHTGTDSTAHTGTDSTKLSGSDINQLGGSDAVAQTGTDINQASGSDSSEGHIIKDETTRTGSQSVAGSGTDVNSHGVFTFDDTTTSKPSAINSTEYGKTDTTTYNSVKDSHVSDSESETTYGRRDETTYGKTDTTTYGRRDTTTYGKQDTTTFNSNLVDTKNLHDKHVEMVIRQGNIGVTKSTELLFDNMQLYENENFDFFKYVVRMCVNQVTYAVEGV